MRLCLNQFAVHLNNDVVAGRIGFIHTPAHVVYVGLNRFETMRLQM